MLEVLAMAFLFCALPAQADEDGFFCVAKGYLAYELRNGITPGVTGHVLRVVRFDSQRGIYRAGEVGLQDFQVHRMICSEDRVEISGWGKYFKKYVIEIAGPQGLHILDYAEDPTRQFDPSKEGPEPSNLAYEKPGTLPLDSSDPDHKYQLRFSGSEKSVEGGIQHYRKAELLQLDLHGNVSQRLVVYENRVLETID
jgi:hypothetical protein